MTSVTFRCDDATEALLDSLARDGESRSDTIRRALLDAARLRRREQMRAEARALVDDAADLAESRAVRADLDPLRAW
ncbi:MAG: ribbon-helix-helix protein, CopG family [Actinomycetales bacterium]|nr:ribbon-helix-helix protein, CopG family [Actinomycetales bacterium]